MEDYLRSSAIARFSPIMQAVERHAASGRPLIGICNGFQVLVEACFCTELLLHTQRPFICSDVHVRVEQTIQFDTVLTHNADGWADAACLLPMAKGGILLPTTTLKRLENQRAGLFVIARPEGLVDEAQLNGNKHRWHLQQNEQHLRINASS